MPLSGFNARRVVFGPIKLDTGHRLLLPRRRQPTEDFQLFLPAIRRHYRVQAVALLLEENPSYTAQGSQAMAADLGMELIWLPIAARS